MRRNNTFQHRDRAAGSFWRKNRKWWSIAAVVAIVLGMLVGYSYGSVAVWQKMPSEVDKAQLAVTRALDGAMRSDANLTSQKRLALLEAIPAQNTARYCDSDWWHAWQTALPSVKDQIETCETQAKELRNLLQKVSTLKEYLGSEKALATVLQQLQLTQPLGEKSWSTASKSVEKIGNKIKVLPVSKEYESTKQLAITQITAVEKGWKALLEAHKKKDRPAFEKAEAALGAAYGDMKVLSGHSQQQLGALLEAVTQNL